MRAEERIARLEVENARLREQISQLLGYVAENAALLLLTVALESWP